MNIKEARAAIEAILAEIPDSELPPFDKIEERADRRYLENGDSADGIRLARKKA